MEEKQTPYLSVIVPSFKGADILKNNLPVLMDYLSKQSYSSEVVVVDDGSLDMGATQKVALNLGCRYTENPMNMGKGAAVRRGIQFAKGRFLIFTDVDIPFETEGIERFLYYLDFKEFNIVVGDRHLPGSSYFTEIPASRKIGSAIFTFIVGRFVTTGMFDTQCGMKGFRKETAEALFNVGRINGFAFDVELIYIALKRNLDIKRLPVRLRNSEGSTVSLLKHSLDMVVDLLKIKYNHTMDRYEEQKPETTTVSENLKTP
ncbi:MAG: glycosyltransferase [Bacteroidetes bacterium]|nr:glycosyltransferase [Bacteroidota bacterium]